MRREKQMEPCGWAALHYLYANIGAASYLLFHVWNDCEMICECYEAFWPIWAGLDFEPRVLVVKADGTRCRAPAFARPAVQGNADRLCEVYRNYTPWNQHSTCQPAFFSEVSHLFQVICLCKFPESLHRITAMMLFHWKPRVTRRGRGQRNCGSWWSFGRPLCGIGKHRCRQLWQCCEDERHGHLLWKNLAQLEGGLERSMHFYCFAMFCYFKLNHETEWNIYEDSSNEEHEYGGYTKV